MRFDRQPGCYADAATGSPRRHGAQRRSRIDDYGTDPALAQCGCSRPTAAVTADPLNNELRIHTWGNERMLPPERRASAHMSTRSTRRERTAIRPPLKPGDLLAARGGPRSRHRCRGRRRPDPPPGRADRARQSGPVHAARPVPVADQMHDQLYLAALDPTDERADARSPRRCRSRDTLPLVEVTWRKVDALAFPLCLSAKLDDDGCGASRSRAATIGLADHGRTVDRDCRRYGERLVHARSGRSPVSRRSGCD